MAHENINQNPREVFDENEESIAQKKQEITQALEAGDYDKVATLAQDAKNMEVAKSEMKESAHGKALEDNKTFDEAKAAQEKAQRNAKLAEQAQRQSVEDAKKAADLLEKLESSKNKELTNEQILSQLERDSINKHFSEDTLRYFAEIQNIALDIVKERGLDVNKVIMDKVIFEGKIDNTDYGTGFLIATNDGALSFFTEPTGRKVVIMSEVEGANIHLTSIDRKIYGKEAEDLWKDYKPEVLHKLYEDAIKIFKHRNAK